MEKQFTIYLDRIEHFFVAPEFDMFSAHPNDEAGIDIIVDELRSVARQDSIKTTVFLPADQITPELTAQLQAAIKNYCDLKIEDASQDLLWLRKRGFRALLFGLAFLAICLSIGLIAQATLSPIVGGFLFQGFTVIGWVSLWHPSEMLLFDWYPLLRIQTIFKQIEAMAVEIKAA